MAVVPVELVFVGDVPLRHVKRAVSSGNTVQSEFHFSILPEAESAPLAIHAHRSFTNKQILDIVAEFRRSVSGFHPHMVAVTDAALEGATRRNLFGSCRSASGLAVVTTSRVVPHVIKDDDRLSAYFIYYMARYSLQFLAPKHKVHDESRNCIFDRKIDKRDLLNSMDRRSLCGQCRTALAEDRGQLSDQQFVALDRLFAVSGEIINNGYVMPKPKVFIGSSSEGLAIAEKIQQLLAPQFSAVIWNQGTAFGLGDASLEALERAVAEYEFGVFVFTPDDELHTRGETKPVARDNVVFELGLFIGKLTRKRAFVVNPSQRAIQLPSDLAGITTATYDPNEPNIDAMLGPVASRVRQAIQNAVGSH